jgi:ketol-acid reductoisomerase
MKLYYDNDANLELLKNSRVAIYGYGSQGHAHAQNLKDSGINVCVALRENSKSAERVKKDGLKVKTFSEAAGWADFHMLLVPDQHQKELFETFILPQLKPCSVLAFAHGFNIHYGEINCPEFIDVVMIAPKSPGHLVRKTFVDGQGTPCLMAVYQDYTEKAAKLALSYAKAIGGTRAGVIETTFKNETETDLFGEQAVLCGGVSQLIKYGFETLEEAGYPAELAYFECLHELKLIVDLFYEGGLSLMNYSVSDTAEYGGYTRGPRILDESVKIRMKTVLKEVQDGTFAKEYLADAKNKQDLLLKTRAKETSHSIEKVGAFLRSKMTWLQNKLVKEDRRAS